jgi:iron complex outermembrane receptor protein
MGSLWVQADLGVRGATFQQVLILLDGVRMNDPQTGHHNLDLPINLEDLERIEVLHGQGSSLYGADAFGGVVNFITRLQITERQVLRLSPVKTEQEVGLFPSLIGLGILVPVSLGGKMSDGYRFDTDFKHFSFSSNSALNLSKGSIGFSLGYLEKEFGANGFYGNWPSREWINTILGNIRA